MEQDFRSSITWLSDWLSTLRREGYQNVVATHFALRNNNSTQDSLLAVGQTLPDGIHTRRVTTKGFRFYVSSFHLPPSPSFLAQTPYLVTISWRFIWRLMETDVAIGERDSDLFAGLSAATESNKTRGAAGFHQAQIELARTCGCDNGDSLSSGAGPLSAKVVQ